MYLFLVILLGAAGGGGGRVLVTIRPGGGLHVNKCSCCCSVAKSYLTLCDPVDCSTPGFPVLHYLLEFAQAHVYWVSDAVQPSYPLLPASVALSLSNIRVFPKESLLCIRQPKYWSFSFSISPSNDWFPLGWIGWISLHSKGLSRVFSNTAVQKHQYFGAQLSL